MKKIIIILLILTSMGVTFASYQQAGHCKKPQPVPNDQPAVEGGYLEVASPADHSVTLYAAN